MDEQYYHTSHQLKHLEIFKAFQQILHFINNLIFQSRYAS